jgi:hypothetical protein
MSGASRAVLPRWYAPGAVVVLLIGVNIVVARITPVDLMIAGQSARLSFQAGERATRLTPLAGVQGGPSGAVAAILAELPANRRNSLSVLYVGNSQTMAVMDMEPGDRIVAAWLTELLNDGRSDEPFSVRLASEANLTMSELLIKSIVAALDASRRPDAEIVGIVLDGLRWVEARAELVALARSPAVREYVRRALAAGPPLPAAARALETLAGSDGKATPAGTGGATAQRDERAVDKAERRLQQWSETNLPLVGARRTLLGTINLKYTELRNWAFGFKTTTKRPIAPALYATNLELIELTLRFLHQQGIRVVFYIAPIRPLEPGPYLAEDVERFRRDLARLCQRYGAVYADYTGVIPGELWTNYPDTDRSGVGGQPDFAHFTGRAHRRLAERLVADVGPQLQGWLAQKR